MQTYTSKALRELLSYLMPQGFTSLIRSFLKTNSRRSHKQLVLREVAKGRPTRLK